MQKTIISFEQQTVFLFLEKSKNKTAQKKTKQRFLLRSKTFREIINLFHPERFFCDLQFWWLNWIFWIVDWLVVFVLFPFFLFVFDNLVERVNAQSEVDDKNHGENVSDNSLWLCRFLSIRVWEVNFRWYNTERCSCYNDWQKHVRKNCKWLFLWKKEFLNCCMLFQK